MVCESGAFAFLPQGNLHISPLMSALHLLDIALQTDVEIKKNSVEEKYFPLKAMICIIWISQRN